MSTKFNVLTDSDPDVRRAGQRVATDAQAAKSKLLEQIRHAIEHEVEIDSIVNNTYIASDCLLIAIERLIRDALMADPPLEAMWETYWSAHRTDRDYAYPKMTRIDMMEAALDTAMEVPQ